jgi:hypothetical protein
MSLLALSACAGITTSRDLSAEPSVRARAAPARPRDAQEKEEYRAALAAAVKRGAAEPIEIVVCGATVAEELSGALDVRATIQAIARELWDEPLFRVRAVHDAGSGAVRGREGCVAAASARGFVPDIWAFATAEKDDATERIRRTGNLMAGATLTVRVDVASTRVARRSRPSASGPVDDALSVVVDAARAARFAILDDIAPELPSHASTSLGIGEPDAYDARTAKSHRRVLARR